MTFNRKTIFLSFFLSAGLFIGGCAGFYANSPSVETHIDMLIKQQRYDKALDVIAAMSPNHEKYDETIKRAYSIKEKRATAISRAIDDARALEAVQDWAGALSIIDTALGLFNNESSLIALRKKYDIMRMESIRQSNHNILMARGRYLSEIRDSEEKLLLANPGKMSSRRRYRLYQQDIQETSEGLHVIGRETLEQGNIQAALQLLILSEKLHSNEKNRAILTEIYQALWDERSKTNIDKAVDAEDQWPDLANSFNMAIQAGDLSRAHRLLRDMNDLSPEKAEEHEKRLEKHVERKIKTLNARGCLLYEQGFIEESLDAWRAALRLKPDDPELMQNVRRAETFLGNIRRWKE